MLAHQVEIYHSIIQRKVLAPNGFADTAEVARTLSAFERHYNEIAVRAELQQGEARLAEMLKQLDNQPSPTESDALAA